ncbi:uncharacterized protein LOC127867433 [Dreissena polymorpha]|nr:uncharacterized protein LOC127867433 [Dreissena polymorpha]XP_052264541.1 uncharacterized protein LOC127867433 [Dreissena polymorpha]
MAEMTDELEKEMEAASKGGEYFGKSQQVTVFLIDHKGKTLSLDVRLDQTIGQLKELVEDKTGVEKDEQLLMSRRREIGQEEDRFLHECEIKHEDTLQLRVKLRGVSSVIRSITGFPFDPLEIQRQIERLLAHEDDPDNDKPFTEPLDHTLCSSGSVRRPAGPGCVSMETLDGAQRENTAGGDIQQPEQPQLFLFDDDPDDDKPFTEPLDHTLGFSDSGCPPAGSVSASMETSEGTPRENTAGEDNQQPGQPEETKSFKYDECEKQVRDADDVEFQPAKKEHSSFSESSKDIKPLMREEKGQQLANDIITTRLREMFVTYGRTSKRVQDVCKIISKCFLQVRGVIDCYPAYMIGNETNIVFVLTITDNIANIKQQLDKVDIDVVIKTVSSDICEHDLAITEDFRENYKDMEILKKCILNNTEDLMQQHKYLSIIKGGSNKQMKGLKRELCLVLYVHAKGFIPIDEEPFKKSYDGIHVKVLEGRFTPYMNHDEEVRQGSSRPSMNHANVKLNKLRMGCTIEGHQKGTLGVFIEHPSYGLCGITCAHVAVSDEVMMECESKNGRFLSENGEMVHEPKKHMYQPYRRTDNSNSFGQIVEVIYKKGNLSETGMETGMEIALVQIEQRHPDSGKFPTPRPKGVHDLLGTVPTDKPPDVEEGMVVSQSGVHDLLDTVPTDKPPDVEEGMVVSQSGVHDLLDTVPTDKPPDVEEGMVVSQSAVKSDYEFASGKTCGPTRFNTNYCFKFGSGTDFTEGTIEMHGPNMVKTITHTWNYAKLELTLYNQFFVKPKQGKFAFFGDSGSPVFVKEEGTDEPVCIGLVAGGFTNGGPVVVTPITKILEELRISQLKAFPQNVYMQELQEIKSTLSEVTKKLNVFQEQFEELIKEVKQNNQKHTK